MRRVQAFLLLVAISFGLIAPLLAAPSESKLPACCRRDGKHGCAMMARGGKAPGIALKSSGTCPLFPSGKATAAHGNSFPALTYSVVAPAGEFGTAIGETESRSLISYSRCRQQRGPPSPLS